VIRTGGGGEAVGLRSPPVVETEPPSRGLSPRASTHSLATLRREGWAWKGGGTSVAGDERRLQGRRTESSRNRPAYSLPLLRAAKKVLFCWTRGRKISFFKLERGAKDLKVRGK